MSITASPEMPFVNPEAVPAVSYDPDRVAVVIRAGTPEAGTVTELLDHDWLRHGDGVKDTFFFRITKIGDEAEPPNGSFALSLVPDVTKLMGLIAADVGKKHPTPDDERRTMAGQVLLPLLARAVLDRAVGDAYPNDKRMRDLRDKAHSVLSHGLLRDA